MADFEYIVTRIDGDDSITVINDDGDIRFVSEGEVVSVGDTILSIEGGQVVLTAGGQNIFLDNSVDVFIGADLAPQQDIQTADESEIDIDDDFLAALDGDGDLLDSLDATAAGAESGGEGGDGSSFVRVDRVSEDVDPVEFEYNQTDRDTAELETQEAVAADFDIEFDLAEEINDVTPTITGTTSAPEGTLIQVVVTDQNGNSQNVTSVVENDGTFTINVDSALPEGGFTVEASITDNQGNTTTVSVNSSVDITAPAINNLTIDSDSDTPSIAGDTDAQPGTNVIITVTDANGDSQVINSVVQDDGSFSGTPDTALADGEFTVVTQVTDEAGNTTSQTTTGSVGTTTPTVTDTTTANDNTDTPTFTGNTNAEPGSEVTISVTDANGDTQVINAVVQDDGSFSGTPDTALAEGEFSVVTEVTDAAGNTTSTTSTGSVDTTAPTVTDNTTPNSNTDTPTFTGNSNAEPGSEVTITVTDANGDSQVINAVVQEDGTYSGSPANALAEGEYSVVTEVTDAAGNTTSTTSTGSVDTTAPTVTDTTTPNNNTDTPIITGNTNAEPGSEVTITVTDANGDSQVINAVVQEDGSYSGSPANALAEGEFTVVTQVTDEAGNTSTQTTTGNVDTQAPNLSVDAPDNSNDPTPTITGTTDAPVNATVNLTVTESDGAVQTLSASVQANGTYSAEVPVDLAEGSYTVEASVADAAGNEANASDTGNIDTAAPLLTINTPDVSNDDTPIISGTTDNAPGTEVNLVVTDSDGISQTLVASVQSDGTFSIEIATPLADGPYTLNASTEDEAGNVTNVTANSEVNSALPNLTIDALPSGNDATPLISGNTDAPEGSSVNIIVTDDNGSIQTLNTSVQNDGSFSLEVPVALADGGYSVEVTVSDGSGNQASASGTGNIDTTAPILSVDAPDNSNDATPTISGTTDAPVNSTVNLTVTGSNGAIQTLTAEVQANGTFTADVPVDLAEGNYTVAATVADEVGNEASASDTGSVDTQAPNLTVDAPDNSSDATPTITGTTDAPVNATVNLTVTGSDGAVQTLSASVQANGTYSVDVPTDLAEGNYSVAATVADAAGNEADASDTGSVDTQAPVLTVDAPDNSSDATPTITGTTDEPDNAIVSITVTGSNGVVQTFDTTVMDNAFSVDVPSDLVDGNYTVSATITDASGNSTTESDTGSVDTVAPSISVDAPDNSSDATPSITGTTSTAPVGATVTITVTGSDSAVQNLTATVQPDGSFHVDVPVALEEGSYTVEATVADAAGNTATDSDTGSVDTQAPTLSIVAPDNSNDATPTITGSTDEPENATVSILVTDAQGVEQTLSATVQSDGSFSVDVPNDLAQGNYTVQASITDAAGNSTTESDTGSVDTEGPTIALTVVGEVESGFPILSGTCSEPEGTVITVVITDSNNVEFSLSAQVDIDGLFTVVIPATAADGDASAVISVTDLAGNETVLNATVPIDLTDPVITLDKLGDIDVSANLPSITGTCSEPEGTVISVTLIDSEANEFNLTTTVGVGGLFTVLIPGTVAQGEASAEISITDIAGNETIVNATVPIDLTAPLITLDKLGDIDVNLGLPVITGSCGEPAGSLVSLTLTDNGGTEHVLTSTVLDGGLISVSVPLALAQLIEGNVDIALSVTDASGNQSTETAQGLIDVSPPSLTLDDLNLLNILTLGPLLTGTSSEPAGTIVSVSISALSIATIETQAVVQEGGGFGIQLGLGLPGLIDIEASVTDLSGNTTTVLNSYDALGNILDTPSTPSAKAASEPVAEEETLSFALDDEEKIDLSFTFEESSTESVTQNESDISDVNGESAEVTLDIADLITDPADELFTSPEDNEVVNVMKSADSAATSEPAADTLSVSLADQELLKSLVQNNSLTMEA